MAQVCVSIPDELELELELAGFDISVVVKEALVSRLLEKQLSKSKALQRALLEALIAKSKLTEEDAHEIADKIKEGMLKELEDKLPAQ